MKKLALIVALFFFSAISFLNAQVIEDFEVIQMNLFSGGTNGALDVIANPDPVGNESMYVGKMVRGFDGDPWAGWYADLDEPFDASVNKYIHLWVWKPRISPVVFKLENPGSGANTGDINPINVQALTNQWEELVFDMSAVPGVYTRIVLIPDFENPLTLTEDITLYFDHIYANDDPAVGSAPVVMFEDFEHIPLNALDQSTMTRVVNPDMSGINTSHKVIEMNRAFDGVPWAGFWSQLPMPYDITDNKYFHVKVWKPRISPIKFKIEKAGESHEIFSMNPQTMTNAWEDIVFDFSEWTGEWTVIAFLPDFEDPLTLTENITIYFDDIRLTDSPIPMSVADVTMNVNMSYWTSMDKFDPAEDFVDVAGNFNDWDGANHHLTTVDDIIYSITLNDVIVGTLLEFKFRINGSWSDETAEFPSGGPNRTHTVVEGANIYDCWYNDDVLGISENSLSGKIQMFPNPSVGDLIISTETDLSMIVISTLQGRQVASFDQIGIGNTNISISDLSNGLYFVTFYGKSGEKLTQKLIKK
jgi:hypothetical protein